MFKKEIKKIYIWFVSFGSSMSRRTLLIVMLLRAIIVVRFTYFNKNLYSNGTKDFSNSKIKNYCISFVGVERLISDVLFWCNYSSTFHIFLMYYFVLSKDITKIQNYFHTTTLPLKKKTTVSYTYFTDTMLIYSFILKL